MRRSSARAALSPRALPPRAARCCFRILLMGPHHDAVRHSLRRPFANCRECDPRRARFVLENATNNAGRAGTAGTSPDDSLWGQAPADEELPVDGVYQVTTVTRNDTCSPDTLQGVDRDLMQGTSAVANLNLWSGLRQDVPWSGGEPMEKWKCDANDSTVRTEPIMRAAYELSDLTSHSFKAVSQVDWNDPTACPQYSSDRVVLPSAPCSVERTQTYELIAACPTKLDNVGCPGPSR